jgi:two-component system chemotaxis sensor kinase CheA
MPAMDAMAAIRETFFQECEEQLGELEAGLTAMEEGQTDSETVNAVFRAVHSIKGGAGAFKLNDLVHFAHVFETTLDEVRAGRLEPSQALLRVMLRAADVLADLVHAARDGTSVDEARSAALLEELGGFTGGAAAEDKINADGTIEGLDFQPVAFSLDMIGTDPAAPSQNVFLIKFTPKRELYAKANESALLLRELGRLGSISVTCDTSAVPPLEELDPEGSYLAWNVELTTDKDESAIRELFEFVDEDCELEISQSAVPQPAAAFHEEVPEPDLSSPAPAETQEEPGEALKQSAARSEGLKAEAAASAASPSNATIRVDLDRVDRLINLVGELVINQAMLSQRVLEAGLARASGVASGLDELEHLTRDIQESVMAIRAQPVKPLFQRMSRIVREVADQTGKAVRLKTEGESVEVDRTVIERLADPLTHMIRNAIDHGLEKPEARKAADKPAEGVVHLSAAHRSGRVVIEVADDGGGINRAKVKASAVSKGLISAEAQLSDSEIDNLIFLPGFSTADTVSSISGRGVGMDVVKRSIQALGGRISIASRPGRGSTFTMSLPLTLAVLDGMVVRVADQTLVVPLTAIVETLKPKEGEVRDLGSSRVISNRGKFVPLIDVGRELGYRDGTTDPLGGVALLVETERGACNALLVDSIQDQRQVVIKSLETNYGRVPGVAAATILGDGRIALILDVDAVVARSGDASYREPLAAVG